MMTPLLENEVIYKKINSFKIMNLCVNKYRCEILHYEHISILISFLVYDSM